MPLSSRYSKIVCNANKNHGMNPIRFFSREMFHLKLWGKSESLASPQATSLRGTSLWPGSGLIFMYHFIKQETRNTPNNNRTFIPYGSCLNTNIMIARWIKLQKRQRLMCTEWKAFDFCLLAPTQMCEASRVTAHAVQILKKCISVTIS